MAKWESMLVFTLLATYATLETLAQPSAKDMVESHSQTLQEYDRYVQHLRQVLEMMARSVQHARKRSGCLLNGGMAHSCDLKDVVSAVDEAKYWSSFLSPGKRRSWPAADIPSSARATDAQLSLAAAVSELPSD